MKTCTKCHTAKSLTQYYSHIRLNKTTGKEVLYCFPYCKKCNSEKKRELDRTREGIAHTLYLSQQLHSRKRGYPPPTYSEEALRNWLHSQSVFETLFQVWEDSGFSSDLKPSCNRIDDYAGYALNNIELTTWKGNKEAWARDCLAGKNLKISRPIKQFSLQGEFIQEYFSLQDASRKLGIPHGNIVKNCTGERQSAGGFRWEYVDPRTAPKHTGFTGGA